MTVFANIVGKVITVAGTLATVVNVALAETATMRVITTERNPPAVYGTTNLPEGTLISVTMRGDYPACSPQCAFGGGAWVVDGAFIIPINDNEELPSGFYTVDIHTRDNSGRLTPPISGPMSDGMILYTMRLNISAEASALVPSTSRFVPFPHDDRYIADEAAHGHPIDR